MIAGCDDKKNETPKVDAPKADNGKPAIPNVDDIKKAADSAKVTADKAAADAKSASDTAAKATADAAATAKANATDWMAKLEDAIKAKKLDDAKTYLDKLDAIKASLPADLQSKLASLKTAYDGAKTGAAIPATPGNK